MSAGADERVPTVSLGLPVFNGENYLAEAIESILGQTYGDFELIISDNASTDGTEKIVLGYADADDRIRYHRNPTNIGGSRNQTLTMEMSRGRYYRMAAHDDFIAPTFLEECVKVLDARPEVVICFSGTIVIDEKSEEVSRYHSTRGTADRPSERFAELAFRDHNCDAIYGLMRNDILRTTPPMGNFIDADKVYLCSLAMRGPFVSIPDYLFYKRYHFKNWVGNWRDRMAWFNPDRKGKISLPNWLELGAFVRVVATAKVGVGERLRCVATTFRWALRYSPNLAKDVLVAVQAMFQRLRKRPAEDGLYNWE